MHKSKSGRNVNQVFANGGVGLVLCVFNHFYQTELIYYMFLASIAAANSDTWATEIGKLSRTRPKDIISGRSLREENQEELLLLDYWGLFLVHL